MKNVIRVYIDYTKNNSTNGSLYDVKLSDTILLKEYCNWYKNACTMRAMMDYIDTVQETCKKLGYGFTIEN